MRQKRFLSWLLTLCLLLGMFSFPAYAEGNTTTISGDGAAEKTGTMTVTLVIPKKTPAATDLTYAAPSNLTYSGSDKAATVAAASGVTGMGTITVKYYSDASRTTEAAPKNVGTYYVGATVAEGDQYAASTGVLYGDGWTFTITASTPSAPATPTKASATKNSITLNAVDGCEYSKDGKTYQDSTEFTGLMPGTEYTFYQRVKATANTNASAASSASFSTEADTYAMTITLVIKPAQTITAENVTATYGDTDKSVSASVTEPTTGGGAISYAVKEGSGDYISVNESTGTLTIRKVPPTDGKAYVIVKAAGTDDYAETTKEVTVTISPAEVTVTAKDQSIYVDSTVPDLSSPVLDTHYSVTGLVGEDKLTTAPTLAYQKNGTAATPDNTTAGTYDIIASGASAGNNYTIAYSKGTLTISDKGTQTITADDVTVTYGDTDKKVSASVTDPTEGGGTISYAVKEGSGDYIEVDATTGALTIKKVPADGKAYVTVTAAETAIYEQATKEVTVTINKADPIAPTGLTATYGQTLANVTLPDGWTWADSTQSVGNVVDPAATFKANFTGNDNYNAASNVEVTVTVGKADPTAPTGLTATYGQTLANVTLPDGWTWADSTQNVGNVVDPAATFKANFTGNDNYNAASNVEVTVTVGKANAVAATVTANNRTYDGTEKPLVTVAGETIGGMLKIAVTTVDQEPDDGAYTFDTTSIPAATDAGTYYVWYKVVGDANHNDTTPACVEVKINPVDKKDLNNAITEAETYYNTIKDEPIYTDIASALKTAIDAAKAIADNDNVVGSVVTEAITEINQAKSDAEAGKKDADAANAVTEMINALPAEDKVTVSDAEKIAEAREAYEALTDDQKKKVTEDTLGMLEAREAALTDSFVSDVTGISEITEENKKEVEDLLASYDKLTDSEKAAVDQKIGRKITNLEKALDVTDRINKLGSDLDVADEKAVIIARTAYELLTDAQKAMVSEDTLKKLEAAEKQIEALKEADALKDAKATAVEKLQDYAAAKALSDASKDEQKAYEDVVAAEIAKINAAEMKDAVASALTAGKNVVDDKIAEIRQARADAAEMAAADEALKNAKTAAEAAVTAADAALGDTYVPADDKTAINTAKSNLATALDAANGLNADATAEQKNTAAKNVMDAVKALTEATDKANVDSAVAKLEEATAAEQLAAAKETAVGRLEDYSEAKALTDATQDEKKAYEDVVAAEIDKINAAETPEAAATALTAAKKAVDDKLAALQQARAEAAAVEEAAAQLTAAKKTAVGRLEDYSEAKALTDATADEKKAYEDVVAAEIAKINAAETPDAAATALTAAKKAVDDKLAEIRQARADAAEMAAADEALSDAKTAAEAATTAAEAALKDTYVPEDDQTAINTAKSNLATALDAANGLNADATAAEKNTVAKNVMDAVKALTEATDKANVDSAVAKLEEATAAEQLKAAKETAVGRLNDYSEAKALTDATADEKKAYEDVVAAEIAKINAAETPEAAATALTAAKKAVDDKLAALQQARAEAAAVEEAAAQLAAAKETAVGRLEDYSEAKALTDATPDEKKAYEDVVAAEIAKINAAADKDAVAAALTAGKKAVDAALAKIEKDRADADAAAEEMAEADENLDYALWEAGYAKRKAERATADEYASDTGKKAISDAVKAVDEAVKAAEALSDDASAAEKNAVADAILEKAEALEEVTDEVELNSAAARAAAEKAASEAKQLAAVKETATDRLQDYADAKAKADATPEEKAAYEKAVADGKAAIAAAKDPTEVAQALSDAKAAVDDALAKINADRAAAEAAAQELAEADKAVEDAKTAAETAKNAAAEAVADKYATDADKTAVNTAKEALDAKIKAATDLPADATAQQRNDAAKAIEDAVKALNDKVDTANVNSAAAKAAAEAEADAAAQLAAAKTSASERLDDYSEAKDLADANETEKAAYDKAVADGKAAIAAAKDPAEVAAALTQAKAAVDDALAKINADRAAAAAAAEEMAEAEETLTAAEALAEIVKAAADDAAADEYASEADKKAISDAAKTLEDAVKAANALADTATAADKKAAADAIVKAAADLNAATDTAEVNSAAAKAAAGQAATEAAELAAAKKAAIGRLEDYAELKAKEDATAEEKAEYDQVVADVKAAIEAADVVDAVDDLLKAAKEAINAELAKIDADRAAAEEVTKQIDGISATKDITVDDKDSIEAARAAYDALTDDQKAKISKDTLKNLEAAEATLAVVSKYSKEWVDGKWYNKDATQTYLGIGKWHKSSKGWWFGDNLGWYAKNQWQKIDGKWYFFDREGYMEANAYRQGYYLKANGAWDGKAKVAGWKQDSKGWWYSLGGSDFLKNGWKKIDGNWYYFKATGYIAINEFVQGWWLNKAGAWKDPVQCSWHKAGSKWWYGTKDGWYAKSKSYTIDGEKYTFDKKGYTK